MKKCLKIFILVMSIAILCGCGVSSKAKKGYNKYIEVLANELGTTPSEVDDLMDSCTYVYLEETGNYYYKLSMTVNEKYPSSTIYFVYYQDLDYVSEDDAKISYKYAYDLYLGGYSGETGKIK